MLSPHLQAHLNPGVKLHHTTRRALLPRPWSAVEARSALEAAVRGVWAQVLGVDAAQISVEVGTSTAHEHNETE